jgi:hypothetical protein
LTRSKPEELKIKDEIEGAFRRNAEADANPIMVEANGDKVTSKGREVVGRSAGGRAHRVVAPGVTKVEDRIIVGP